MKIGILTFHSAINYGAVLQTYALQEYLKSCGHEVYVIDYRPEYLLKPYRLMSLSFMPKRFPSAPKWFLRELLTIPIRLKRRYGFNRFCKERLNLFHLNFTDKDNDFDAFVFGSDQIWNPRITNGFDRGYFGDYPAAKGKKLIAYAASSGSIDELQLGDVEYFRNALNNFSAISVREAELADYINSIGGRKAVSVCDPVLLAGMEPFDELAIRPNINDKYLLLFQLKRNENIVRYARSFAEKAGLKLIEAAPWYEALKNRDMKQSMHPAEFVGYFKYASYVLTTSYHGTVFSVLFKKQFNTIRVSAEIDARSKSLLSDLGLEDRLIGIEVPFKNSASFLLPIDYSEVYHKLDRFREKSMAFLKGALASDIS